MKRRSFIKTGIAGTLAGLLLPEYLFSNPLTETKIGLQLYTLRNEIEKDLEGSLGKISGIGYELLEAAGYSNGRFYGLPPASFRSMVEKAGMKLVSSHATFDEEETVQAVKAHREAGISYMVWPWIGMEQRESAESYMQLAGRLNAIGKICKDNGIRFGYHNHDFEFNELEGKIPYDILLENTDPGLVFMEIDLYWITYAGKDPVEYFKKYPGRFELWHIKDMAAGKAMEMTEVGRGVIDYTELFGQAALAGMKEFFVEQDVIQGDGFESVKQSHDYLRSIL
jgi:sugar phosphate isomerase/epimerase